MQVRHRYEIGRHHQGARQEQRLRRLPRDLPEKIPGGPDADVEREDAEPAVQRALPAAQHHREGKQQARDQVQKRRSDEIGLHLPALITTACSPSDRCDSSTLKPRSMTRPASSACEKKV